jgi:CRISPR-associated protein Csb1
MENVKELLARIGAGVCLEGNDAGIRVRAVYQPLAGAGTRLFPPTYPSKERYVTETRMVSGVETKTVIVDALQSQANRVEQAVLDALDAGLFELPHLNLTGEIAGQPFRVTSLDAPHRSPDAYFRDSEIDGQTFDATTVGKALRLSSDRNARAIFAYSPMDLVLGLWDSHRSGRGAKIPRSYTSEMIGVNAIKGSRAANRIDPENIPKTEVYVSGKDKSVWDVADFKGAQKKKPSEIGHGNALAGTEETPGGFTVDRVERVGYVSFAALSRLRFPDDGQPVPAADRAARALLASLALLGDVLAFGGPSVYVRSGTILVPDAQTYEFVGPRFTETVDIDRVGALALFNLALSEAKAAGLPWSEPINLSPKANLTKLVELARTSAQDEAD